MKTKKSSREERNVGVDSSVLRPSEKYFQNWRASHSTYQLPSLYRLVSSFLAHLL